ncbi:MAG: fibrobacter succinogenes major paralogous domain-containing protein, partial [Bacteroidales bacterium]|nr:fibrobacter succinogenes major paralogous domain-containing protein [Bacteroidales bacterium]
FENDANYITAAEVPAQVNPDWNATSGAAQIMNKPELFSGDYNDLTNQPTIPTTTNELTNNSGFITNADIPTNVSAFTNDANYITSANVPTNVSELNNDAGYITSYTEQQILSISNDTIYLTGGSFVKLPAGFSGSYNDLTEKPTLFSGSYNDLTDVPETPEIPTQVSTFNNDAGYLTRDSLENYNLTPADIQALLDRIDALEHSNAIPSVITESIIPNGEGIIITGGNVFSSGTSAVTTRGVCWGTNENPTIEGNHTSDGGGLGRFTSNINGLVVNTTYYVRAYAINATDTAYGDIKTITTVACPSTVTDIDGNTYNTVIIGTQCWMKENLRTTKKPNGSTIPSGIWAPGSNSVTTYGRLYSWTTVMNGAPSSNATPSGVQGICPTGWHVPSDNEWKQMEMAVGMSQSDANNTGYRGNIAAKLCGNTGWNSSTNANAAGNLNAPDRNSTGFSALPAGYYVSSYLGFGSDAFFWSATEYSSTDAYCRVLCNIKAGVLRRGNSKTHGFSVRCVRDMAEEPTNPCTPTSSTHNIEITTDELPYAFGDTTFLAGTATGTYVLVRANAAGCDSTITLNLTVGASAFACGTATLTDVDGNTYNTVQIGEQCWMKENLKTTKYADGNSISQGPSYSYTVAEWIYPNDVSSNKTTYGLLYNWKAVMRNSSSSSANPSGVQGICPDGWHVPSDAEWKQMEMAVGMSQSDADNTGYRGSIAAKLSGNTGWNSSNTNNAAGNTSTPGRNSSGFSALPAGSCCFSYVLNPDYYGGYYQPSFTGFRSNGFFWSATTSGSSSAMTRQLSYSNAGVGRNSTDESCSCSVRCVRD